MNIREAISRDVLTDERNVRHDAVIHGRRRMVETLCATWGDVEAARIAHRAELERMAAEVPA